MSLYTYNNTPNHRTNHAYGDMREKDATARLMLLNLSRHLRAHAGHPAADVLTLAAQCEQTAGLVRAELAEGREPEPDHIRRCLDELRGGAGEERAA